MDNKVASHKGVGPLHSFEVLGRFPLMKRQIHNLLTNVFEFIPKLNKSYVTLENYTAQWGLVSFDDDKLIYKCLPNRNDHVQSKLLLGRFEMLGILH